MLDVGIYPITLAWWWLGEPASWAATAEIGPTGVDETVDLRAEWTSGASATLSCGSTRDGSRASRITCESAVIDIPAPSHASPVATITTDRGAEIVRGTEPGLHHQVVEVHRCLAAGLTESPRMTHADSLAIATFMDEVLASVHRH